MALTLTGSTDNINCGTLGSLDIQNAVTVLGWYFPTTLANNKFLYNKSNSTPTQTNLKIKSASGDLVAEMSRAGRATSASYSSVTGVVTANAWNFYACSMDRTGSAGSLIHIYTGSLTAIATEVSYTGNTDGSGSFDDPSSWTFWIGSRDANGAFSGAIANTLVVQRVLGVAEIRSLQFGMYPVANTKALWHLGFNGTGTQPDWSGNGNSGAVTGATQSAHVPLAPTFGRTSAERYIVPAATFKPAWAIRYNRLIGGGCVS